MPETQSDSKSSRWKVIRSLGAGGMGEVFLAETPDGERVAVKTLSAEHRQQLPTFDLEAKLLLKLRHPSVAAVLGYALNSSEIFGEDRGPSFWMEYVEGAGLLEAAKGQEIKKIWNWFRQGLEALQYLHAQGVLHSDLSPRNVLVSSEDQIKLLDFGLAKGFGSTTQMLAGTLPYLGPERINGKNLPASDLFSLGTLFYEVLAKKHPRADCKSLQEMISAPALPLLEAAPTLEKEYSMAARVIDRMITIDTQYRFASAQDCLEALGGRESDRRNPSTSSYYSAQFFGTEHSFSLLEQAIQNLKNDPAVFWLHGITGVGRSRWLREAAFQAAFHGLHINEIPSDCFKETLSSLRASDSGKPTVFLFHALENVSLDDLAILLSIRRGEGLRPGRLLIFEWNDDRLDEAKRKFLSEILRFPKTYEITLKNLAPSETSMLLESALGREAAEELGEMIYSQTAGNPKLLMEWIHLLQEESVSQKKYFSKDWLRNLPILRSTEDVFKHRLELLSAEDRRLMRLVAAAGAFVDPQQLAAVLASSSPSPSAEDFSLVMQALGRLLEREILQRDRNGKYGLATQGMASVLNSTAEDHRAWLGVLEAQGRHDEQYLRHALFLGEREKIVSGARKILEEMRSRGRRAKAVEMLRGVFPFVELPEERSRLFRLQTNLYNELRRFQEALESCEASFVLGATDEPMPLKTAKYWIVSGIACQNLGRFEEARRRFAECLKVEAAEVDSALAPYLVRAHTLFAVEEMKTGNWESVRIHLKLALEQAGKSGRRRAEICRNMVLVAAAAADWPEAWKWTEEAKRLYREDQYPSGEFQTLFQEGNLALAADDPQRASGAYAEAEKVAKRCEEELFLGMLWNNRGMMVRQQGHLDEALRLLRQAEEIFRPLGDEADLVENLGQAAICEAAVGRFQMASDRILELEAMSKHSKRAGVLAQQGERLLREFRDGDFSEEMVAYPPLEKLPGYWNQELALRCLARYHPDHPDLKSILEKMHHALPLTLQVSFVERYDYRRWVENKILNHSNSPLQRSLPMQILESLAAISRELLCEDDMDRVLKHLMDAAMRLASAENGFLVLRSDSQEGPIPGFTVVVAQNINKEMLDKEDFAVSRSAIRQAMELGQPVVTDNALADPRFSQAKSVQLHELKSILALPVKGRRGVLGVFYLDHRFEMGLFAGEKLAVLQAFADQAALALQKGQMIEELKIANSNLSHQVEEQTSHIHLMERELAENRLILKHEYHEIVGRSPKMLEVLHLVDKLTDSLIPVWIFGESGTGKESIARALHFNSSRAKYPFVSENCSALPETLLESELFGHMRGAFTHADKDKVGRLEYANHGTVFLDEIADLSPNLQSKFLRFLQEGEVRRLGSNDVVKVDVRTVSASNRDIGELVKQNLFREDLFFRLNGITVKLPPLRERKEDIPLLVDHFLKKIAEREKKDPPRLNAEVLKLFMNYYWPGNIRELQNTVETASLFAEKNVISAKSLHFKSDLLDRKKARLAPSTPAGPRSIESLDPELERLLLAIRDKGYHKGNAAKALGISRRNLYSKLEKFKVPVELEDLKIYIDERFV